jgi:hypothetical protein
VAVEVGQDDFQNDYLYRYCNWITTFCINDLHLFTYNQPVKLARVKGPYKDTIAKVKKIASTRIEVKTHDNKMFLVHMRSVDLVPRPLRSDVSFESLHQQSECPICFENMTAVTKVTGPCGHCVCQDCRSHISLCPICREEL